MHIPLIIRLGTWVQIYAIVRPAVDNAQIGMNTGQNKWLLNTCTGEGLIFNPIRGGGGGAFRFLLCHDQTPQDIQLILGGFS